MSAIIDEEDLTGCFTTAASVLDQRMPGVLKDILRVAYHDFIVLHNINTKEHRESRKHPKVLPVSRFDCVCGFVNLVVIEDEMLHVRCFCRLQVML